MKIVVVDYGMGNLRSVAKALEQVADSADEVQISSDPLQIEQADRVVFPGQGAARECMNELRGRDLIESISTAATTRPFLGICMGLQVLFERSDENGGVDCLALIEGEVHAFADQSPFARSTTLKIPHMGWNSVEQRPHPLWDGIENRSHFYFVHSYFVAPTEQRSATALCDYGLPFTAAIGKENLFATQFHPEKSGRHGLQLLANFLAWNP